MSWLYFSRWSPYLVGGGIGVLLWVSFILSNRPIGCSTAYVRTGGLLEKLWQGAKIKENDYYRKFTPGLGWEVLLVGGIIFGSFISAQLSGTFAFELVPELWESAFGSGPVLRAVAAVLGGFLVGFGARLAGGCTSGHGISGTAQLGVGSWLALFSFFIGGFAGAYVIYVFLGGL